MAGLGTVNALQASGATATASKFSKYVHDHSQWIIEKPIRIVVIVVVSLVIRALVNRAITKAVRPVEVGAVPRILRPFKDRMENSTFLETTGIVSERRNQRAATIGSVLR